MFTYARILEYALQEICHTVLILFSFFFLLSNVYYNTYQFIFIFRHILLLTTIKHNHIHINIHNRQYTSNHNNKINISTHCHQITKQANGTTIHHHNKHTHYNQGMHPQHHTVNHTTCLCTLLTIIHTDPHLQQIINLT